MNLPILVRVFVLEPSVHYIFILFSVAKGVF